MRWQDDELGRVSPCEFIPVAESSGLVHALDRQSLAELCQAVAAWRIPALAGPQTLGGRGGDGLDWGGNDPHRARPVPGERRGHGSENPARGQRARAVD